MVSRVLALALLLAPAVDAFAPFPVRSASPALRSAPEPVAGEESMDLDLEQMQELFEDADKTVAGVSGGARMSEAVPWWPRPAGLDYAKLAGDRGFDPAGFVKDRASLLKFRDAEIKHSRLAMLAAAGWPLAELYDKSIASVLGLPSPIAENSGLSPSVLNGGLGLVSPVYWLMVVGLAAAVELKGLTLKGNADFTPGDYGFDPLGLYPKDGAKRSEMQESELRHGRTAMVAIVAFAAQEFVSKVPVTRETPFFFEPIWAFMHDIGFFDLSRGFIDIPN